MCGTLVAAGVAIAAFGPGRGPSPIVGDPIAPAISVSTLPVEVVGAAPLANGQSVLSPASGRPMPAPAVAPNLVLDAETVRTADVRLAIPPASYRQVFIRATSVAATHDGFVASSSSSIAEGGSWGQVAIRIPVENFDAARRSIAELGDVESETVRGQDVSAQLVDYEARQRSLEAQEEALRALVGRATTVGEVLQIQPTLTSVRQQIEQLRGQRASLDKAAALSTILVTLREPGAPFGKPSADDDSGVGRRVEEAIDGAAAVVGGMIVAIGWAAPLLAVGAGCYLIVVPRRRRASGTTSA